MYLFFAAEEVTNGVTIVAEEATTGDSAMMQFAKIVLVLFLCFGLPFILGHLIAKALKLRDLASKIGWILCAITLASSPFMYQMYAGNSPWSAIKLGIDLAGGSNLVYALDVKAAEKSKVEVSGDLMGKMVGAIIKRINPDGTKDVVVRQVGADRVEVIIPGADKQTVEDYKYKMTKLGSLEFAIVATPRNPKHQTIINKAQSSPSAIVRNREGKVIARWHPIKPLPNGEPDPSYSSAVTRQIVGKPDGFEELLVVVDEDETKHVTGQYLRSASPELGEDGSPAVGFLFNSDGARLFRRLTRQYKPLEDGFQYQLSILLDDLVQSAPAIITEIGARGTITGNFTQEEVQNLVNVLNAGALPVPLEKAPIQEYTIGALLGEATIQQGKTALMLASVAVLIFMLGFYGRYAGVIADVALLINMVLIVGTMAFIKASFTLPGLAGLVLTIGMAVDANVLIFERIREELGRGSSLRMAIQNGFSRAFTTIVDANVTTLITAVILYFIGTDQVKGFAVTLFIGIVMSMFAALYIGRLFFDILERKRWMTELKMRRVIGATHWDFINKRHIAAVVSLVLIAIGLVAFWNRGDENYDIDFRGGTMVSFRFTEKHDYQETKDALEEKFLAKFNESGITLESLPGADGEDEGLAFKVRSTATNLEGVGEKEVEQAINEAFPGQLTRDKMEFGTIEPVAVEVVETETEETPAEENANQPERHAVVLSFSSDNESFNGLTFDTITRKLSEQLVDEEGNPKFTDEASLFAFDVIEGYEPQGSDNEVQRFEKIKLIADSALSQADLEDALKKVQMDMEENPAFSGVQRFEGRVASDAKFNALYAIGASLIAIIAYIWIRFQRITFGFAAVAALVHDVLCVIGLVALASYINSIFPGVLGFEDFKINLPMIAALLTIVGYSLNDTIVVFDRIREVRGKNPSLDATMVNTSLNQTLARTLLTSLTTLIVVVILYAVGGEGIHGFAFCLVVGVVVGTYSSIFVASPVLLFLMKWTEKRKATT
ncbi:protein translocase subunit SecD [Symmachiella dynata]|uniref:protein translocase subunit SecD n=1 Tax=Symmachiella dynata TaxID=2527995 RepID=UPI0030EBFC5C